MAVNPFGSFGGIEIVVDRRLGLNRKQVRFPRSKKKRIRKKWRKRARNWASYYEGPEGYHIKPGRPSTMHWWQPREMLIVNPPALKLIQEHAAPP